MTAVTSRRSRSSSNHVAFSAGRGLALILVAIGIGMLLLYVVDDGTSGPANDAAAVTTAPTVTTTANGATTETTAAATRPPAEVRIKVYNASGVAGAAGSMTDDLATAGYTDALAPGNLATSATTYVACRSGFAGAEAAALATAVGANATVQAWPDPAPSDVGDAACIIVIGKA